MKGKKLNDRQIARLIAIDRKIKGAEAEKDNYITGILDTMNMPMDSIIDVSKRMVLPRKENIENEL